MGRRKAHYRCERVADMESVLHVGGCHRIVVSRRCWYMAAEDRNGAACIDRETEHTCFEKDSENVENVEKADAGTAGLPDGHEAVADTNSL